MTGTSALVAATTGVSGIPAASALFAGLLDDAALFPPGDAPMDVAVPRYLQGQRGAEAQFVGSFLCSSRRVAELRQVLPAGQALDLALVVPDGIEALPEALNAVLLDERLQLRAVELPAGGAGVARTLDGLDALLPVSPFAYVEVPLDEHVGDNVEVVAAAGRRVKMRTGGTSAAAFPSAARLAAGLVGCVRAGVPFKLTAGLHHAVRHRDSSTGFEHHGFLNVLAAVASAADGGKVPQVAALLEDRDAAALAQWAGSVPALTAERTRRLFVGFGTCSTQEPLDDLRALGLLPEDRA